MQYDWTLQVMWQILTNQSALFQSRGIKLPTLKFFYEIVTWRWSHFLSSPQTVHFKVHDPKMHCKGGSRENTISRGYPPGPKFGMGRPMGRYDEEAPPPLLPPCPPAPPPALPAPPPPNPECDMKDVNRMFGMTASDIDKYSRVIFPVTFTCFQLMYWVIYRHLSDDVVDDLVYLNPEWEGPPSFESGVWAFSRNGTGQLIILIPKLPGSKDDDINFNNFKRQLNRSIERFKTFCSSIRITTKMGPQITTVHYTFKTTFSKDYKNKIFYHDDMTIA